MRWGIDRFVGRRSDRRNRESLTFTERRHRAFKRGILAFTALVVVGLVGGTRVGRYALASAAGQGRLLAMRLIGLEPGRAEVEAVHRLTRARTIEQTHESLSRFYRETSPEIRELFRVASMDPDRGLIGSGRRTDAFVISSEVFETDSNGRSYRLLPNRKSVWLRQVTLLGGPFGLFLVPDNPEMRAAAKKAGAIVDEPSVQTTNSWGLRGPEPDPSASVRGIVLGDSFMLGMFNGDRDTPPFRLQQVLEKLWGKTVSVLNTGHIGYAPEQYYHTLKEYGERFKPHFVVLSVCPNDFGPGGDVLAGRGDDWDEARYWIEQIVMWCRAQAISCLLVPVPCDVQFLTRRRDSHYPAPICDLFIGAPNWYLDALDVFVDEHLRLMREGERQGKKPYHSPLYNQHISDNHFSPAGAELWGQVVAHRLDLVIRWPAGAAPEPKPKPGAVIGGG